MSKTPAPVPEGLDLTRPRVAALLANDTITTESADVLGRLAVMERLCYLMQANESEQQSARVDFGKIRDEAFWHGLHLLADAAADGVEGIQVQADELYALAKTGGAR